jgi:hypothetical protein
MMKNAIRALRCSDFPAKLACKKAALHRRFGPAVLTLALTSLSGGWATAQGGPGQTAPVLNPPAGLNRPALPDRRQPAGAGPGSVRTVPVDPAINRATPRINRNPAFREDLPPGPPLRASDRMTIPPQSTDSSRVTIVPNPAPCDPRNSTSRPVRIPESDDLAASPCRP